jgi:hypothetical protein
MANKPPCRGGGHAANVPEGTKRVQCPDCGADVPTATVMGRLVIAPHPFGGSKPPSPHS